MCQPRVHSTPCACWQPCCLHNSLLPLLSKPSTLHWNTVSASQAWLSSQCFTPCLIPSVAVSSVHLPTVPSSSTFTILDVQANVLLSSGVGFSQSQPVPSFTSQQGRWAFLVHLLLNTSAMPIALHSTATSLSAPPRNPV